MQSFFVSSKVEQLKNLDIGIVFLNLKHVNSNNQKVEVTCYSITNQTYYIFNYNML